MQAFLFGFGIGQTIETDFGGLMGGGKAVGQPAAIRRPVHAADALKGAAIYNSHRLAFQIDEQQFVAVVGQGHPVVGGRDGIVDGPPKLRTLEKFGRYPRLTAVNLQPFFAAGITDEQQPLAVV